VTGERIKDHIHESRRFGRRALASASIVVLLLAALVARLGYLQILQHEHFQTLSRDNRVKVVPLPPTRGLILDRKGRPLASNRPAFSIEVIPEQAEDLQAQLDRLGQIISITDSDLERFHRLRRQKRRFESIPVKVNVDGDEAARFAVHRHEFPGFELEARLARYYPDPVETSHVLGYVGRISLEDLERISASDYAGSTHIGKIGVEKTYEQLLHGEVGLQQVEVNALGKAVRILEETPPKPGYSLQLHLDLDLQRAALDALGEENGAVVAIDVRSGGVLALVSKPGYDTNLFVEGIGSADYRELQRNPAKPLYNRALRGQYPPGSTVKPFFGLAGLETGVLGSGSSHYCRGFFQLPGVEHKYRDWKKGGHGTMGLDDAIVQSCDVFFYELAFDLGIDRMHQFMSQFHFGRQTGIDLVGELNGLLPSREWKRARYRQPWYPGETLIMGIGQGYFTATPLQLAAATAALANGGTYLQPRIVAEIRNDLTDEVRTAEPGKENIAVHEPANWQAIKQAMLHVVEGERGTAKRIRTDQYRIAGKTGTAQVFTVGQEEEYDEETVAKHMRDHALFVAYAPADDPRIAVAVIVENGGHGGSAAAPVARRVMDAFLLEQYDESTAAR